MRPKLFIHLLPLVLTLLLSSCGDSSPDLAKKRYKIGIDKSFYPLNLVGQESNIVGFTTDLLFAIAKNQGLRIELDSTASSTILIDLDRRRFDAVISPLKPTPRADIAYDFSEPFYLVGPVLVVRKDSPIKNIDDIREKVIGVLTRSSLIFVLQENPPFLLKPYETVPALLQALDDHHVDGVLLNALVAYQYAMGLYATQLKVITTPLTKEGLRLIVLESPSGHYLNTRFNAGLQEMKDNGTYDELIQKWDLIDTQRMSEQVEALS